MSEPVIVRIDRSTLKRNPRAGATMTPIQVRPTESVVTIRRGRANYTLSSCGEVRIDGTRLIGNFICREAIGEGYDPAIFGEVRQWEIEQSEVLTSRVDAGMEFVEHRPEPQWLFDYLPTLVTCRECGETFDAMELQSDAQVVSDDGDEAFSSEVCPKCGAWDCCDLKYEQPEGICFQ